MKIGGNNSRKCIIDRNRKYDLCVQYQIILDDEYMYIIIMQIYTIFVLQALIGWVHSQTIPGQMGISVTDSRVYQQTDYIFTIILVANDPLQIVMPSNYPSTAATIYPCSVVTWPFTGTSLSCTITNRILKIIGGFPQAYSINSDTIFEFIINDLTNPTVAGQTNQFSGRITHNNLTQIVSIVPTTITITTGNLQATLTIEPTTVSTTCDLIITITPTNPIPRNGWLKLYISNNTWLQSNSLNPQTIFSSGSTPSCHGISTNLPANLYCNYSTSANQRTLKIYNIVPASLVQPFIQQFTFKVSTINSPPTTQSQGRFQFVTNTADNGAIDSVERVKVGGLTPKQILNPSLSLVSYHNGVQTLAEISVTIRSIITSADTIIVRIPAQVSLSALTKITMQGVQIADFQVTEVGQFQDVSFQGIVIINPIQVTILLQDFINPDYVMTTPKFSLWTKRNNYPIDQILDAFSYTTIPGDINLTITPTNTQAGLITNYSLAFTTTKPLQSTNKITILFPSTAFNIAIGTAMQCSSNLSPDCTVQVLARNSLEISNMISSGLYTQFMVMLMDVRNPVIVGNFDSLAVATYTEDGHLIDMERDGIGFGVTARELGLGRIGIVSAVTRVYSITSFQITITPANPILQYSKLYLTIPPQLQIAGISCSPYICTFYSGTTYSIILPATPAQNAFSITINNIRNPTSTAQTDSFQIRIHNPSSGSLSQYRDNSLTYSCTIAAPLSIVSSRNSTKNSQQNIEYQLTLGITFTYSQQISILISLPNSLQCSGCLIYSNNLTHYQIIKTNQQLNTTNQLSVQITGLRNYFSFQMQEITVMVYAQNVVDKIAEGVDQIVNGQPGYLGFGYGFMPAQLLTATTLAVTDIVATYALFGYLEVMFGNQFEIAGAVLTVGSSTYSMAVDSVAKVIRLTKLVTAVNDFSISGIIAPQFTPSTPIKIWTYSSTGYLIDKSASFVWQTLCTSPCRQCVTNAGTQCLSCYSNASLVLSQTIYHQTDKKCISICPPTFYHKTTTSTCQPCSQTCLNCIQTAQKCTTCPQSLPYLLNNICYSICQTGYYQFDSSAPKRCLRCNFQSKFCQTCSNFDTCDTCLSGHYYYLSQCYVLCPENITVPNSYTWNCDPCGSNCFKCLPNGCFQCYPGFLLDQGNCYEECRTQGYVAHEGICRVCDQTCLSCVDNIFNCLTCNSSSPYPYFLENRCLTLCPNGYYQHNQLYVCLPCTQPCQFCENASVSSCTTCITGYSLFTTTCRSQCPQQFYKNNLECSPCTNNCHTCRSSTICMSCIPNYSLYVDKCLLSCPDGYVSINQRCIECSSNCRTCSLVNYCTSCFNGTYLFEGTCVYPCPQKFYEADVCMPCPFQCQECEGTDLCNTCIVGYQLSNRTCLSTCASKFVPIDSICEPCASTCAQCVYTQENCSACVDQYYYYNNMSTGIGKCYLVCPASLYINQAERSCLVSCPALTFANNANRKCQDCPSFCSACSSSSFCTACQNGASKYQNLCYEVCPEAAKYSINSICRSCDIVDCYQCSAQLCRQCNSGFLLINSGSLCVQSCGTQQQYNFTTKQCEALPVETNNTTDGSGTTTPIIDTNSTSTDIDLTFVPMPYLILQFIAAIAIVLLYITHSVSMFGMLYFINWFLLFASAITTVAVSLSQGRSLLPQSQDTSSRLLQQLSNNILTIAMLVLVITCGLSLILSLINTVIYCCVVKLKRYTFIVVFSVVFGLKMLGGLLCSNLCGINMRNCNKYNKSKRTQKQWLSHSAQIQEYISFWKIYDKLQLMYLPFDIALMFAGVIFAFFYTRIQFQFYSGIQMFVLGVIDLIMTIFWFVGRDKLSPKDILSEDQSQNQSMNKIQAEDNISVDLEEQLTEKWAKSEQYSPFKTKNKDKIDEDLQEEKSRGYKSEYNKPKDVLKLKNQQVKQAIQRGIYRRNKASLAQEQRLQDLQSALQSADKFNKKLNTTQQFFKPADLNIKNIEESIDLQDSNRKLDLQNEGNSAFGREGTEIEKQFNGKIIFEDFQESFDTHPQQEEKSVQEKLSNNSSEKPQKSDSLGSLQNVGHKNNTVPIRVESKKINRQLHIQDIQERSNESESDNQPQRYINIFEHQIQDQQFSNPIFNKKQTSDRKYKNLMKSTQLKEHNQILYADLQSVGTVQQFDMPENNFQLFHKRQSKTLQFDKAEEIDERPGKHINTNFRYNKNSLDLSKTLDEKMPKKIPPKKKKRN